MKALRIHIYVQHLLGSGHLVRMKTLASALAKAGHQVTLISGSMPLAKVPRDDAYELFQLPAVKVASSDFTVLLGQDNEPISEDFKAHRRDLLLQKVAEELPQVLVVETFPFGRRALRFELLPLLEMVTEMNPRPLRLCSVRDILQLRSEKRYRQTVDEVDAWFDHVLVHGDSAVAKLRETFPLADQLNDKVFYSGYIHVTNNHDRDIDQSNADESAPIIISAGGGAVGFKLLQTAIEAKRHSQMKDRNWRVLVGRNMAEPQFATLKEMASDGSDGIVVEWNRTDFAQLLTTCAVSVSQAGYNTVLDAIHAQCGMVLVPFSQHGETEQTTRAEKIAQMGRAVMLQENELMPQQLAAAIDRAAQLDLSSCKPIKMDGATATTDFIENVLLSKT